MNSESIGPYLKQARETQGLSLDQVASLTRIQPKYLLALEEEEFADLPEQVFTRGFVRTYARSLGMDEQDVLRRFSQASSGYYERGQQEHHRVQQKLEEERRGKLNRNLVIVISAVVVLIVGLLLAGQESPPPPSVPEPTPSHSEALPAPTEGETETAVLNDHSGEEEVDLEKNDVSALPTTPPDPPPVVANPPEPDTAKPPKPEVTERAKPEVAESPKPQPAAPPVVSSTAGPLRMELEATQMTWVVVKSDENEPQEALLQPGQQTTWEATEQFTLTLGNAGGIRVKLNGKSRGPFGKQGEVVREVVLRN